MRYMTDMGSYFGNRRTVVTFGKFDGLHRGHQKLIETVKSLKEASLETVVCGFSMKGKETLKNEGQLLMTVKEKQRFLEGQVDVLLQIPFTEEFARTSPEDFIESYIHQTFHAKYVVVGEDFRFGHDKKGDIETLKFYEKKYDYQLFALEKERHEGKVISSTYIKEVVWQGNMELVLQLLGYGYGVTQKICHGMKLGRRIGYPTINQNWPSEKVHPPRGVYFGRSKIRDKWYPSISNLGIKPTVTTQGELVVESHLIGLEEEIYHQEVTTELFHHHRKEQKFDSKEDLKHQINQDMELFQNFLKDTKRNIRDRKRIGETHEY